MNYTKDQARIGKKLVAYLMEKDYRMTHNEARMRTVDILSEHSPEKIMRALADPCSKDVQNFLMRLNLKNLRHLIR